MASMPEGRMIKVRAMETALRTGESFARAGAKVRVSATTAKDWAAKLGIQKRHLEAETPDMRLARHAAWALALASLGRMDEAAAWEAETRKLETTTARIANRAAVTLPEADPYGPTKALLAHIAETLGEDTGHDEAWSAVHTYYLALRRLGAEVAADGQVSWPEGVPDELPETPGWLPCDPWAVEDAAEWHAEGFKLL